MSNLNKANNAQPISVYVRLRPFNENEQKVNIINVENSKDVVVNLHNQKKFSFDGVFGLYSKQIEVYRTIAKPLISEILSGYNCTVFAYGQTGSGKTFTMTEGISCRRILGSLENVCLTSPTVQNYTLDEKSGLIPRVLTDLFQELQLLEQQYTVRCSYLEIYNEDLRDLLSTNDDVSRIRIYDDQRNKGGVIVQGIEEVTVHNTFDAMRLVQRGQERRHTATTQMNDRSSRSHTIFTIIVHTRETGNDGEELVKMGKINLVDLAGSENINRSGAIDRRAREAGNINQSLLTLGRVIKALSEKNSHIPFRESKLTRILQDSLGGKTKTSIIATISPCTTNMEETMSTLDYAHRARGITNKPETNQRFSQKRLVNQYIEEISRLRKDLDAARTGHGIVLDTGNYEKLIIEQTNQKEEISQKITRIKELENQIRLFNDEKEIREREWNEMCISFEKTRLELNRIKWMYEKMELEKMEQEYLAQKYQKNAENLHQETKGLLNIVSQKESVLADKVAKLYEIGMANNEAVKRSCANMEDTCQRIREHAVGFTKSSTDMNRKIIDAFDNIQQQCVEIYQKMESLKSKISSEDDNDVFGELSKESMVYLFELKDAVMDRCTECIEFAATCQEWSSKELQLLVQMILSNEEKRKEDLTKMNHILNSLTEDISSQKDFHVQIEKTRDCFLQELDGFTEELQSQPQSTNEILSLIAKSDDEILEFVATEFSEIERELNEIKSQNSQCMSLVKELQTSYDTKRFKFRRKLESFVEKSFNSIFEHKHLTDQLIQENFNKIVDGIRKDHDQFVKQINNSHSEAQRILDGNFNTIQKNVLESCTELLSTLSDIRSNDDDIFRRIEEISQDSETFNSRVKEGFNKLESETNCLMQNIVDPVR